MCTLFVDLQVQCLAVPILALVQDSPEVFYFVEVIAIFCQNITVVVLIFGPKMYRAFTGQGDLAGGTAIRRTTTNRATLSRRVTARPSFQPTTGEDFSRQGSRRTSSTNFEMDQSAQFTAPVPLISGETDSGTSEPKRSEYDEVGLPLNRTNSEVSFQDARDLWVEISGDRSNPAPTGSSHRRRRLSGMRKSSIDEECEEDVAEEEATETKEVEVVVATEQAPHPTTTDNDVDDVQEVKSDVDDAQNVVAA